MASTTSVSSPKKRGTKYNPARWDDDRTRILLEIFESEIILGNRPTGVFSKQGWINVVSRFNEATGLNLNKDQLKNKQDNLRREYTKWENLIGKETGLGWDHNRRTLTAPDEWWIERSKDDPTILRYKDAGPIYLELMQRIFGGVTAIGYRSYIPEYSDTPLDDGEHIVDLTFPENIQLTDPILDGFDGQDVVADTDTVNEPNSKAIPPSAKLQPKKRKRLSTSGKQSQCDKICEVVESISNNMRMNLEAIQSRRRTDDQGLSYVEALELLLGIPGMSMEDLIYWKAVRVLEDKVRRIAFGFALQDGKNAVMTWLSTFPDVL